MSDTYNWAFGARDAAKAEIRVAVRYLLKDAAGTESRCRRAGDYGNHASGRIAG